jgi:hypothetical protein
VCRDRTKPVIYSGQRPRDCGTRTRLPPSRPRKAINGVIWPGATDADMQRSFQEARALGVDWMRVDFRWDAIMPNRGEFDWAFTDRLVALAAGHNIRLLPILTYAPGWAAVAKLGESGGLAPRGVDDYEDFVTAAVRRYGPDGTFTATVGPNGIIDHWELWNEPNLDWFWGCATPHDYAILLAAGAGAVRAVDPDAVVVLGGLSPSEEPILQFEGFLNVLYDAGVSQCFDVVNLHPYHFQDQSPTTITSRYLDAVEDLLVQRRDLDVPIWHTEFGYKEDWASADAQSTHVNTTFSMLRQGVLDVVFWFALRDFSEETFGLMRPDFSRKPAYDAFATGNAGP